MTNREIDALVAEKVMGWSKARDPISWVDIPSNCAPCCTTCNRMKMALTVDEFITAISKIHSHHSRVK